MWITLNFAIFTAPARKSRGRRPPAGCHQPTVTRNYAKISGGEKCGLDHNGQLPRQNIYLLVRMPFRSGVEKSRFGLFRRQPKVLREEILRFEIEVFKRTLESLRSAITALGSSIEPLTDQSVFSLIYHHDWAYPFGAPSCQGSIGDRSGRTPIDQ